MFYAADPLSLFTKRRNGLERKDAVRPPAPTKNGTDISSFADRAAAWGMRASLRFMPPSTADWPQSLR